MMGGVLASAGGGLDIIGHIKDGWEVMGHELPEAFQRLGISFHVLLLMTASLLCMVLFSLAARGHGPHHMVPRGGAHLLEVLLLFIRDEVVRPALGRAGDRYLPVLWTFFFFILFSNLLGLVPGAGTATANIGVTATLAVLAFSFYHLMGIREQGPIAYLRNIVPPGLPLWLLPLMILVEAIGHLAKPFALAVRLCANMTAGHIVILVIIGFIFTFQSYAAAGISVPAAVALNMLEIFVALVQAYVFTFLVTVFLSAAVHPEH
ncbi:MAG: F0F1 ATP synthase subunit A [Planctomycetes bacterium]|nr:F0F1 ATP synthase subunit A [Planctomycetota bacterium]